MGACCSFPKADSQRYSEAAAKKHGGAGSPDFGLSEAFEVIKFLGRGAEGEAWLAKVSCHRRHAWLTPWLRQAMHTVNYLTEPYTSCVYSRLWPQEVLWHASAIP